VTRSPTPVTPNPTATITPTSTPYWQPSQPPWGNGGNGDKPEPNPMRKPTAIP
jgi:hypothetical protein